MESQFTKKGNSPPVSGFKYETPDHPFHVSDSNLKNDAPLVDEEIARRNDFRLERIRACLKVLKTDKSKRKRILVIRKLLHGALFVLYLLALIFTKKWNLPFYSSEVLFFINMILYFFPESPISDKWIRAFRELLQFDDLLLTGTFVEELPNIYSGMLIDTQTLLTKLLFRFKENDAHALNRRQRRILLSYMGGYAPYHDFTVKLKFRLSILHALSFADDRDVLSHFILIARGKYCGQDCPELAGAAQESVARMQSRLLKLKESDTLLRASSPASAPANELLRPAEGGAPTVDEELLRPME